MLYYVSPRVMHVTDTEGFNFKKSKKRKKKEKKKIEKLPLTRPAINIIVYGIQNRRSCGTL